jgi:hypothetical protein
MQKSMDYKYIEQLMERYWNAETSLEEESILRTFFRQENIPAEMEPLRALFADEASQQTLDDDFDVRMLEMIGEEPTAKSTKARVVSIKERLMPLFKSAAVVAILLTLGNAAQAPWDNSWKGAEEYANMPQVDTVEAVSPILHSEGQSVARNQAETIGDITDSTQVIMVEQPTDEGF